ncbi:MAG: translocation/assembly module TamB [Flavobacteriaceae bacterium]|nr:translocation/assembly module TamB [Flavobacteriaceae bacterium]
MLNKDNGLTPIRKRLSLGVKIILVVGLFLFGLTIMGSLAPVQTYVAKRLVKQLTQELGLEANVGGVRVNPLELNSQLTDLYFEDNRGDTLLYISSIRASLLSLSDWSSSKGGNYRVGASVLYYRIPKGDSVATLNRFLEALPLNANQQKDWSSKRIEARNLSVRYIDENRSTLPVKVDVNQLVVEDLKRLNGLFSGKVTTSIKDVPTLGSSTLSARIRQVGGRWEALDLNLRTSKDELNLPWVGVQTNPFNISAEMAPSFISPELMKAIIPTVQTESSMYIQGEVQATSDYISLNRAYVELGDSNAEVSLDLSTNNGIGIRELSLTNAKLQVNTLARQLAPKRTSFLNNPDLNESQFHGLIRWSSIKDSMEIDVVGLWDQSEVNLQYTKNIREEIVVADLDNYPLDLIQPGAKETLTGQAVLQKSSTGNFWSVEGFIEEVFSNSYQLQDITLKGSIKSTLFTGQLSSRSPKASFFWDGYLDLSSGFRSKSVLTLNGFDTSVFNSTYLEVLLNGRIESELWGTKFSDIQGSISSSGISAKTPNGQSIALGSFQFGASLISNDTHQIQFQSTDLINGSIRGNYHLIDWSTLKEFKLPEDLVLRADVNTGDSWRELFKQSLSIPAISGFLDYRPDYYKTSLSLSSVRYQSTLMEAFKIEGNTGGPLNIEADRFSNPLLNVKDVRLVLTESEGILSFTSLNRFSDRLDLRARVERPSNGVYAFDFSNTDFTLKGADWQLIENPQVVIDLNRQTLRSSEIVLSRMSGGNLQFTIDYKDEDNYDFEFISEFLPLASITPDVKNLELSGLTTGTFRLSNKQGKLSPLFNMGVEEFSINGADLGFLNGTILGNEGGDEFDLKFDLRKGRQAFFEIEGVLESKEDQLLTNLKGGFNSMPLAPLSAIGSSVFDSLKGTFTGPITLIGNLKEAQLLARLNITDGGIRFPYLGMDYTFNPEATVEITQEAIQFNDIILSDSQGLTKTRLMGTIDHSYFKDYSLDLAIDTGDEPSLMLNTPYRDGALYYGKGLVTGTASFKGSFNSPAISVKAKTFAGTEIQIPLETETTDFSDDYIRFVSDLSEEKEEELIRQNSSSKITLDFDLEITPEAEVTVLVDEISGTELKGSGTGLLLMRLIDGEFSIFGDYAVSSGNFNYRFGGLIDKDFDLQPGGTIAWQGDPYDAQLNLTALYRLSANPAPLLNSSSYPRPVNTDVSIRLGGAILQPQIDFGINFPNLSSVIRSEIEYRLRDQSTLERNVFFLLAQGSFVNDQMGISQGVLTGNLMQSASGLLDRVLGESESFDLGLSYEQGFTSPQSNVDIEDRIGVTVSTKLGKRVLFNGKLGVPVGGVTETVVAGDVELQVILNEEGTLSAKIFNRENTLSQVFVGAQGYTQGLGLSYQVDFENFKDLIRRVLKSANQAD